MSRCQYNQIMTYGLRLRQKPSNPDKISNFVGRVKSLKIFIGSFANECDFMILEDTTSIIDRCLGEMVFGRPSLIKPDSSTTKKKEHSRLSKMMRKSNLKCLTSWKYSSKQDLWARAPIPYPRSTMKKTLAVEGRTIINAYSLGMSTGKTKEIGEELGIY
ncbi:hypothetical protein Tco_1057617 [Tanacetum coccineum]|uniref:Uncharacterized protein n=1 Tax=Tanacetum coccineum TaxID=301880 RepID=A0ABQ5H6I4_9ASTR